MLRKALNRDKLEKKDNFKWRSHEITRIEAFTDAVFAFAVTLLVVSLEVPNTYDELAHKMKGFFVFAVGFALLMQIWYGQFVFFRRYGLQDLKTIILNLVLIFVVLFYVYPLKFVFNLILPGEGILSITASQVKDLMVIYGIGFISIYVCFMLLYHHAYKQSTELSLTSKEVFDTKTKFYGNTIMSCIGLLSVATALVLPDRYSGLSGFVYILISPALSIFFSKRGTKRKNLLTDQPLT
ncbi:hypothetical protein BH10BAC5_BH10BAC5_24090 [soil metagenome]